jgi:hypothetical protein
MASKGNFRSAEEIKEKSRQIHKQVLNSICKIDDEDLEKYSVLDVVAFEAKTDKAVLLNGVWTPLSVLGLSEDGKLMVKKWFGRKEALV